MRRKFLGDLEEVGAPQYFEIQKTKYSWKTSKTVFLCKNQCFDHFHGAKKKSRLQRDLS